MARLLTTKSIVKPSSTLLGCTKLQASSTAPVKPAAVPRPPAVRKPRKPHLASLSDYL